MICSQIHKVQKQTVNNITQRMNNLNLRGAVVSGEHLQGCDETEVEKVSQSTSKYSFLSLVGGNRNVRYKC